MYKEIAFNKNISFKEKIKRLGKYLQHIRGAKILWNRKYDRTFKMAPQNNAPVDKRIEAEHVLYWKPFRRKVNLATLRVSSKVSGLADPKYIPEEIFQTDIEPSLNRSSASDFFTLKSFYNHWFQGEVFPRDFFHNIDGIWLDHQLNIISFNDVKAISEKLDYPVVIKPNKDSYGGKNIVFPKNKEELLDMAAKRSNFLVQEKIKQHEFFNRFNPHGINSTRVNIYRSVIDDRLHVINHALRFGVGGSLDNLTSGGIGSMIKEDGVLSGFATDSFGRHYPKHPDTGLTFDQKIPDFDQMLRVSLQVASKIFYARIICLDLCYDNEGRWRMLEVNINSTTLKFAQFFGSTFFGEFTDEVREYCIKNHWALSKGRT